MPDSSQIKVTAQGGRVLIQLSGEVDIQAVPPLQAALAAALTASPDFLRIDLAEVTYLSLSAMGAILTARERAVRSHADVVITEPPRTLRRLMEMHGPRDTSSTSTVAGT